MKRKWHHPEEEPNAKVLVRSLGELQDAEAYRERNELEFPKAVESMRDEGDRELSRRGFVKLMGASTALAGIGLAACRRPVGHIIPYANSVEWIVPGKPLLYTTAMPRLGGCTPLIATTHEGRPTHLQGNPMHPGNPGGGTDSFATSSILDLYDPERSGDYKRDGAVVAKSEFDEALVAIKKDLSGVAVLHGDSTSPTRQRVLAELAGKGAQAYSYEALNLDNLNAATEAVFGEGARPSYDFSKAKRILSLGCDFLGLDRLGESGVAQFSEGRKIEKGEKATEVMNRLYVLEHAFTLTGGMADHRLPVAASQIAAAAAQISAALSGGEGGSAIDAEWVRAMVADLKANDGLVVAGPRQPVEVHALALAMNQALGAIGKSLKVVNTGAKKSGTITELAEAIKSGAVKTLVITTQADPVYDAPTDLKFGDLLDKVENVIHLSPRNLCATARAANWQVPGTHYLEEWGDVRASDGTYSIVQPLILPLYDGVSELNFLLSLTAAEKPKADENAAPATPSDPGLDAVKATFAEIAKTSGAKDVDQAWNHTLRDGFLPNSGFPVAAAAGGGAKPEIKAVAAPSESAFEVVFTADSKVWDGRYINNGWQQECPDPISKVVWDNAALVSIATLRKLGIREKDLEIEDKTRLIQVTVNGVDSYYPVIPAPGHADNSVSISMGYGQVDAGKVAGSNDGSGTGFDCFPQRTSKTNYIATGATVKLVDEKVVAREGLKEKSKYYPIALTQEHNSMEGRAIVRDASAEIYDEDNDFVLHRGMEAHTPKNKQIYEGQTFDYDEKHQWGMTVDLNACIGCSACTIACQSENNIPIVGKEQVIIGREMHWIRMDRYFAPNTEIDHDTHKQVNLDPDLANPQMLMQPVACQQCEAAPCETVCPVNATVHTDEGLNSMAYNRCIGTRYCMNNCPYKARRFNFFDYNKRPIDQLYKGPLSDKDQTGMRESHQLQKNPNVTVRMRGVVEKCTYCVQRLQEAKFRQKKVGRGTKDFRIPTDSVKSACQTACPANAIEFGDLADKDSAVVKAKESPRSYDLLGYLGVRPRTSFLGRVKNPNTEMPGHEFVGTLHPGH